MQRDLLDVFTPADRFGVRRDGLADAVFEPFCEGVWVAQIGASFIDGVSRGVAGYVARTAPRAPRNQADVVRWVGLERFAVAVRPDEPPEWVYHVGTGGPLFPSRQAAGEAARQWRFGKRKRSTLTLQGVQ